MSALALDRFKAAVLLSASHLAHCERRLRAVYRRRRWRGRATAASIRPPSVSSGPTASTFTDSAICWSCHEPAPTAYLLKAAGSRHRRCVIEHRSPPRVSPTTRPTVPWNKGAFVGPKPPLKPKQVWSIRLTLQREGRIRDLAMFDLAVDSKLRGCDLVQVRIGTVVINGAARHRATIVQQKTGKPVQFELDGADPREPDRLADPSRRRAGRLRVSEPGGQ